jgi:hypothetical protein
MLTWIKVLVFLLFVVVLLSTGASLLVAALDTLR